MFWCLLVVVVAFFVCTVSKSTVLSSWTRSMTYTLTVCTWTASIRDLFQQQLVGNGVFSWELWFLFAWFVVLSCFSFLCYSFPFPSPPPPPPSMFLWFLFGLFCVFGSIVPFQLAELSLNPRAIHPSLCLVVDTACTPNFHSAHGLPAILEISLSHRRKKNRIPESRRSQRSQKNIKTINPSPQFSAHFMCCDHQTDYCVARSST